MKELKFTIPTSLSEITLGNYMVIQDLIEQDLTEDQLATKVVGTLCGLTDREVRLIPKNDFEHAYTTCIKTLHQKSRLIHITEIDGVEYGLIPNFDKMTFGEYIDLDTFIQKREYLPNAMSVLFRKIKNKSGGRYNIEDYTGDEDADIMKDITMDVVNGVLVFFYHLGKELLKTIPHFLQEQAEKDTMLKQTLEKNGDGINQSMALLAETLGNTTNILDLGYINV